MAGGEPEVWVLIVSNLGMEQLIKDSDQFFTVGNSKLSPSCFFVCVFGCLVCVALFFFPLN